MAWQQLSCRVPSTIQEAVVSQMEEAGAVSVTFQDAEDESVLEPLPGETPLWKQLIITALYPDDMNINTLLTDLQATTACEEVCLEALADQQWERAWMVDYHPMQFGQRLWIYPTTETLPDDDSIKIRLDPGLAFGTGTHETTALCLQWLDELSVDNDNGLKNKKVLDFGCGSGVLGIAALKLGALSVIATDIDGQALLATRENATRNNVAADRLKTCKPEFLSENTHVDILLANILAEPLLSLAEQFSTLLLSKGHLVLSGILTEQAESVIAAYQAYFEHFSIKQQQDWVRITAVRR